MSFSSTKNNKTLLQKLVGWIYHQLRINNKPTIQLYDGFCSGTHCVINGHTLKTSPLPRKNYRDNTIVNIFSVLRLFFVVPKPAAFVELHFEGKSYTTQSEKDGFFHFYWDVENELSPGRHPVLVNMYQSDNTIISTANAAIIVPQKNKFAFISDIDDTFLVSHSATILKRLYVLLTENAYTRRPFEGVVKHYQQLETAGTENGRKNPFFYVSSSEWNLYDYIKDFVRKNQLPDGVFLLNQIKTISQILATGKKNHSGKFTRIVRIMEAFPDLHFVLLGDDSQQDPYIYESVVRHFPGKIFAVYLRAVKRKPTPDVENIVQQIKMYGVHTCYFMHSAEAREHSQQIGLV